MTDRVLTDHAERMSAAAYWELLVNLTKREIMGRYTQSLFGVGWAIAQPLATMAVFTFVFSRLAKMPSGGAPYPVFAYAALVPWFFFSNSVSSGTLSLITYRNIVTKTYFPREVIPFAQVCSRLLDFVSSAALFAVLMIYYRVPLGPWALATPLFFILLMLFTIGVTLATSAVNVFYRDVNPVVQIGLQLWLYLTPVAYSMAQVSGRFRWLFILNPLSAIVEGFRSSLVFGKPPDWALTAISASMTLALFVVAFATFKRMDRYFADVIKVPTAIQLESVSKRYRAGRSRTVVDLVASGIGQLRGARAEVHSATRGKIDANIWALSDVSFDVPEGAGLGIIGRNGAGKTTLLKLVSRVTWPTSGSVRVAGRVVSLIELGAGFHPELTGRDNVYLGGGLFGLTRREIDRSFDRIVEFAGVERLIDTPMKRYSSGLYARLGFAVAVFSRPDIVLVDEVLAVGDAAFRRRALESLRHLIAEGKTVLFISHDMWNVRRLCGRILWMEEGRVRAYGAAADVAERYMSEVDREALANQSTALQTQRPGTGEVRFLSVDLVDELSRTVAFVDPADTLRVRASYRINQSIDAPVFHVALVDVDTGIVVASATSDPSRAPAPAADGTVECRFTRLPLRPRQYAVRLAITDRHHLASYDVITAGPRFAIGGRGRGVDALADDDDGLVTVPFDFHYDQA